MNKRWYGGVLAAALTLGCLTPAASAAQTLRQSQLRLADSLYLHDAYVQVEAPIQEKALIYTPGGDVRPQVVYGDTLYGRSSMEYMEEYLQKKGWSVAGAVNGAFFDLNTGLPIGLVVTDGVLRCNGFGNAVGLTEDGALILGEPTVEIHGQWGSEDILLHYNAQLTQGNGMVLYSRDFDVRTKAGVPGYHVVLQAERGTLTLDDQLEARVVDIVEDTKSCSIPKNGFVLSLAEKGDYAPFQDAIRSLEIGDFVTLTTAIDRQWQKVSYAMGAGDWLLRDGAIQTKFDLGSWDRPAARTAIGRRANGEVVVYTADNSLHSAGLTLPELAERMAELGCVEAMNLDGGGSTTLGVTRPGEKAFSPINTPEDGEQRACANYLFFVRPATAPGEAAQLHLYPYEAAMLPGGQLELTVRASDRNYMAAQVPEQVQLTARGGTVEGSTFTAGSPGTATVTAAAGSLTGSMHVDVVETPSTMELLRQDSEKPVEALLIESGTALDLTARAKFEGLDLLASDSSFTWTLDRGGTIDRDGLLTAGEAEQTGTLTVSCGDLALEVPVEVRINPMVDLEGHWAREYISNLYFREILKGGENAQGQMVYRPDDSMTRQEFTVAMIRWLGVDTDRYADVELPFGDKNQIADWALPAMRAAYDLGYVTGSGGGGKTYAEPNATITREAAMTMLARTQKAKSGSDALEDFSDRDQVSDWAEEALTAMVERGVINGIDGKLQPQGRVTRAQVAKMLFFMN